MPTLGRFARNLRALLWKPSVAEEVDAELEFHIEMRTRELVARGTPPEIARADAIRRFGDLRTVNTVCRTLGQDRDIIMQRTEWMTELVADLRYALRRLRLAPAFTVAAVVTLGLGIGATTAIFSVVDAVVLRPIPIPQPERVVWIFETNPNSNAFSTSEPNYLDFRVRTHSFSTMAAIGGRSATLLDHGDPQSLNGTTATASYFALFGGKPLVGATYTTQEDRPGGNTHIVLLSEDLWRRTFNADPHVVGTAIDLDGESFTVAGVMPKGYGYLPTDFWTPLAPDPAALRGNHQLAAFGRLSPGVSLAQAQADISAAAAQLGQLYPVSNGKWGARLQPFTDVIVGADIRREMVVLLGAVCFVLLMACANVANLLLVRASTRQREMAVRATLGAGRGRIVRQLLTESGVLALAGAGLGLGLAYAAVPILRTAIPGTIPRMDETTVNASVLLVALGCTVATGVLFGLVPALSSARPDLQSALRQGSRTIAGSGRRLRDSLVVSEVAVAMMLLVGAGLLGHSFLAMRRVNLGFQTDGVLQFSIAAPSRMTRAQSAAFYAGIERQLAQIPGVASVGSTSILPYGGFGTNSQFVGDDREARPGEFIAADWRSVSPGFFPTLGIPLLRGRLIDATDVASGPHVVVIDATMAHALWPGKDPIGKHIWFAQRPEAVDEVVGVVGDVRDQSVTGAPSAAVYFPADQAPWAQTTYLIKARGAAAAIAPGVRATMRAEAPSTPVPDLQPLAANVDGALAPQRFAAWLLVVFASVALVLTSVGLYGTIAFSVAQRGGEIGVRLALGAAPNQIMWMVIRDGVLITVAGVGLGILGAIAMSHVLGHLLFETSRVDRPTYGLVTTLLIAVAVAASYLPARRAARVDPLEAIRTQ